MFSADNNCACRSSAWRAAIKEKLSQPGTGRVYKSRGITSRLAGPGTTKRSKQLHQASAPGEPPAPDIGELRRSIGSDVLGDVREVHAVECEADVGGRVGGGDD